MLGGLGEEIHELRAAVEELAGRPVAVPVSEEQLAQLAQLAAAVDVLRTEVEQILKSNRDFSPELLRKQIQDRLRRDLEEQRAGLQAEIEAAKFDDSPLRSLLQKVEKRLNELTEAMSSAAANERQALQKQHADALRVQMTAAKKEAKAAVQAAVEEAEARVKADALQSEAERRAEAEEEIGEFGVGAKCTRTQVRFREGSAAAMRGGRDEAAASVNRLRIARARCRRNPRIGSKKKN